jgi:hypothetical protein
MTLKGEILCEISTILTSGISESNAPFTAPTKCAFIPKSVVKVTIDIKNLSVVF